MAFWLALFAMFSLVLGAALPTLPVLRSRLFASRLGLLIGFSAGLMLATALHELLPEALEKNATRAMSGAGLGFLALYLAERLTHFHTCRHRNCEIDDSDSPAAHLHPEPEPSEHSHAHSHIHATSHGHADTVALAGMSVHNFADGLTTAAAFTVSQTVGLVVVLAIVLHQMAVGLSLGAIMLRAGRERSRVLVSTLISASFIVIGVLFYHWVLPVDEATQGVVLGVAGGSFLYVAACDLLPEAHADDEGWKITAATIVGYAFALAVRFLAPHGH